MNELISIIVPAYNVGLYLKKTLLSIQNQTYNYLEIILVDDGSSDNTGRICDMFAQTDSRFKVFHIKNSGVANARNVGLKEASGKYIGFVDGDDYVEPRMFEEMYNEAKKSGASIVICGHRKFGEIEQLHLPGCKEMDRNKAFHELVKDKSVRSYLWDKLFEKQLFDGIQFINGRQYEDVSVMHVLFLKANKIKTINQCFYHYRIRSTSITAITRGKDAKDYIYAYRCRCNDLRETPYNEYGIYGYMKAISNVMIDMILRREKENDLYKRLCKILKKMLIKRNKVMNKKEVFEMKMLLRFPVFCARFLCFKLVVVMYLNRLYLNRFFLQYKSLSV